MIVELLVASICTETPECAVRERRARADKVVCTQDAPRRWRCVAAMRSGHVFRYAVERRFGPINGVEYVGGYLVAVRVRGAWQIGQR